MLINLLRSTASLDLALDEFHQILSSEQRIEFESTANQVPTAEAVLLFTDEINEKSSTRKSRILAGRMRGVLEAVQQYSTIVDTATSAQPIAALVWSSIKIVVLVIAPSVSRVLIIKHCSGGPEFRKLFREVVQTLCTIEYLLSSTECI